MPRTLMIAVLALAAGAAHADTIDNAYRLCSAFEATKLTSECTVKGGDQSVEVTIDMTSAEARKACPQMTAQIRSIGATFGSTWRLKIFSPYGERPIASCPLPSL